MHSRDIQDIARWLTREGVSGLSETDLLARFVSRCEEAGLKLSRAMFLIDTLHPVFEGRAYQWRDEWSDVRVVEYARTREGNAAETWRRTTFYALEQSGQHDLRINLRDTSAIGIERVQDFVNDGHTDYLAFVQPVYPDAVIGELEGIYSHWVTRDPSGFSEEQLKALRTLVPALALAMKSASLFRLVKTVAEVYLGRDPARRVLSGKIIRGVAEQITAVLWFSDLRNFTAISERHPASVVLPFLNDYTGIVLSAIHQNGGDVLKLMGDGVLAMFPADDPKAACAAALAAERQLREAERELTARRSAEGSPASVLTVALHFGDVHYGNVGSDERLDFTVIGPAVNELSRISGMCRAVDRTLLVSSDFRDAAPDPDRFVLAGRFALKGVAAAQLLYTLLDDTF
ncbi:MAG: adenylate/guanylate cyclase domain-containing protein [Hyphomicrobiales bacterium]